MKIKIVVEGRSDYVFLDALRKKCKLNNVRIEISGGKNKCEITKPQTIKRIIQNAIEDGYGKIIILIDKVTQFDCGIINSSCVLDIKEEYKKRVLKNLKADVVVADEEIECWFVLDENSNNFYKNCYANAKKNFKTTSQTQLAQRAVKKLDIILNNRNKNKSFNYFLKKIGF